MGQDGGLCKTHPNLGEVWIQALMANQSKGGKQAQRSKRSDPPGSGGPRVETPPDPNFPGARSAHISTRRGQARVVATSWWYIFPDLHSLSTVGAFRAIQSTGKVSSDRRGGRPASCGFARAFARLAS